MGRAFARAVGRTFVDTDAIVVKRSGCAIDEIFARFGEPEFRLRESAALAEVAATPNAVVALGGGTLVAPANRALITAHGRLVYLRASIALLERRIAKQNVRRPLLAGRSVGQLLDARRPLYEAADVIVDIDGKPMREIVAEMKALV